MEQTTWYWPLTSPADVTVFQLVCSDYQSDFLLEMNTCPCCFKGPALLNKAVWSHCMLGVLSSSETGGRLEPSGAALLTLSRVTLGEWKERIQQLQDVSAVLWDNMAIPALADFR